IGRELIRRLPRTCLHCEFPSLIRQEKGAVEHTPGGKHIDHGMGNDAQLALQFLLTVGRTHEFVKNPCLALSTARLLSTLAQRYSQLTGQYGSYQEDKQGNPFL